MKKIKTLIITVLLLVGLFIVRRNYFYNRIINYDNYIMFRYDRNNVNLDNNLNGVEGDEILKEVLSGFYKWEQLPLTKHFKNKFKNRKHILNEIDSIEWLGVGNEKNNDEEIIIVRADKHQNIIEEKFCSPITVECYFKYKMDGDKLDDLELVQKRYVDSTTGELIKKF